MPKEESINTKKQSNEKQGDEKSKDDKKKDTENTVLSEKEIALFTRYGKGPYDNQIKEAESEIKVLNQKIDSLIGIRESDLGLSNPLQWRH